MNSKSLLAERIHDASLALLAEPGVRIEHDGVCRMLLAAGAKAGADAQVIRFPKELIQESLEKAPGRVLLADRTERGGYEISATSPSEVWSTPGMNYNHRGEHRPFTKPDVARFTQLLDRLENVSGVFGVSMEDAPPAARDVVGLRIMAENTRKHLRALCCTPEGGRAMMEMAAALGGGPCFSVGFTAHGPLRWTNLALRIFEATAGGAVPTTLNGEPMAGVSGPVTLAGSAAVGNAEILAALVINQLLEPGRPCIYNLGLAHIFDMKAGVTITGGPENHLFADLSAAMGRFYDLPSCSWVSTESFLPDAQASLEKSIGFFTHTQSGVSLIWGVGQLESELTLSPAQAVIDNEILSYVNRYHRGVGDTEDDLAVEASRRVGIGGEFLMDEHTMAHFRTEFFEPQLLHRTRRENWREKGRPSLSVAAEEKAEAIMNEETEPCVTDNQQKALLDIEQHFLKSL